MEISNEISLLICYYFCFLFNDFVPDPLFRFQLGYAMLILIAINILVNGSIVTIELVQAVIQLVKGCLKKLKPVKKDVLATIDESI